VATGYLHPGFQRTESPLVPRKGRRRHAVCSECVKNLMISIESLQQSDSLGTPMAFFR